MGVSAVPTSGSGGAVTATLAFPMAIKVSCSMWLVCSLHGIIYMPQACQGVGGLQQLACLEKSQCTTIPDKCASTTNASLQHPHDLAV